MRLVTFTSRAPQPSPVGAGGICSRLRTNAVTTGLVPVIHVVKLPETFRSAGSGAAWMAGTSPAMTVRADQDAQRSLIRALMLLTPPRKSRKRNSQRDAPSAPEGLP
jgi:hypothetical protein